MVELMKLFFVIDHSYWGLARVFGVVDIIEVAILVLCVVCVDLSDP
jgi:hypothetical protein